MEVTANSEPTALKRGHAPADVLADPLPGLRVGLELGLGLYAVRGDELGTAIVQKHVKDLRPRSGEANPRAAFPEVEGLRVKTPGKRAQRGWCSSRHEGRLIPESGDLSARSASEAPRSLLWLSWGVSCESGASRKFIVRLP